MLELKNKRLIYWCCQLLGWGGMVLYEMINYLGHDLGWEAEQMKYFIAYGITGILLTHLYRKMLFLIRFWFRRMVLQLCIFVLFTVIISFLLYFSSILIYKLYEGESVPFVFNRSTLMFIVNWSRYVLVWMLCYHAFKLFERNGLKELEKKEVMLQKQLLEMEVLRAQINPHFLFNILNSIRSLINSCPQKAREAATLLSEVLRYTLNYEKSSTVSLAEELGMVEKYLQLEKLRFAERLVYHIGPAGGTENIQVPPVLLLTLAENAIKHGINKLEAGGEINVQVFKNNMMVNVVVENSGYFRYFTESDLGKGLLNTQKRLELVYPGRGVFTIKNADNGKVNAIVKIPVSNAND
jgi:two-component system, LytTR family, sensor kinase